MPHNIGESPRRCALTHVTREPTSFPSSPPRIPLLSPPNLRRRGVHPAPRLTSTLAVHGSIEPRARFDRHTGEGSGPKKVAKVEQAKAKARDRPTAGKTNSPLSPSVPLCPPPFRRSQSDSIWPCGHLCIGCLSTRGCDGPCVLYVVFWALTSNYCGQ